MMVECMSTKEIVVGRTQQVVEKCQCYLYEAGVRIKSFRLKGAKKTLREHTRFVSEQWEYHQESAEKKKDDWEEEVHLDWTLSLGTLPPGNIKKRLHSFQVMPELVLYTIAINVLAMANE